MQEIASSVRGGRKIIHLDMDAFFAAVEQHDFPELKGRPVVVGGSTHRGVVSAASYEARRFGIHSAMPMARALSLCPGLVVRRVRMARYREVSAAVFEIFSRYTDRIEPLSIDEAFLDVTGCERLFGPAATIAEEIREMVQLHTGLTVSAGIAPNKFLAKLASESCKPDGLFELLPEEVDSFLLPLPLGSLWGVGRVTAERLAHFGLQTIADLRRVERKRLAAWLGSSGEHLYRLARGEDDRPVRATERVKSVGHEETFARDLFSAQELRREILCLAERVARRLRRKGMAGRCLTLKVKYADMKTVTRSRTLPSAEDNATQIYRVATELLAGTDAGGRPVRLLGLSLSALAGGEAQGDLFSERERNKRAALDRATDRVFDRYGDKGLRRAVLLEETKSVGEEGADEGDGA